MKKKIIISIASIFIITTSIIFYSSLTITDNVAGQKDNYFNKLIKNIVPNNFKIFIKDTIFVFKKISFLENKLDESKNELYSLINYQTVFEFNKKDSKNKNFNNINLSLETFSFPFMQHVGPRAYMFYYNQNLFIVTGTGILMFNSLENLKKNKFEFKKIDTNFQDLVGSEYIQKEKRVVRGFLIKNNKIFLSYEEKLGDQCFLNSILVSNIKFKEIKFEKFFSMENCQPFFSDQVGGALSDFKDNKILMTIGDYGSYRSQGNNNPQNINSLVGKIISVDELTKEYQILSMGHRNPQGLFYDKKNNVIYSSEHGPKGGDELNIITSPGEDIQNYGWGIASYGDHYEDNNLDLYKIAPLNKSHSEYGFVEPIKYFTPSIAPTQIIKTENFIKIKNKNIIYLSSLGHTNEYGRRSIHQFILDENLIIEEHHIMPIGERIRDIVYIKDLNKIFLYLESSGSIGVLEVID